MGAKEGETDWEKKNTWKSRNFDSCGRLECFFAPSLSLFLPLFHNV